ncbi:hypothetical protein Lser_V15G33806 [Lactuca serriola]
MQNGDIGLNDSHYEARVFDNYRSYFPLSITTGKLKNLKEHIKRWRTELLEMRRKEVFGLSNLIDVIDLHAELYPIDNELLQQRQNAHQKIMLAESSRVADLKQKSRVKWALDGDENSGFFHGIINKDHRVKRINGLKVNGFWINDPSMIKQEVVNHFREWYSEPIRSRPKFISAKFKKLTPQMASFLEQPFSLDEIKLAIWACGSEKAPGPDGFSFAFLKKHWDTIGSDFYFAVKYFEVTGNIDKGCNSSFITLAPKIQDPNTIGNFRPISLIGCLYKTIAKVLAERLKKVVHLVVSPNQTAFIKDRYILDGPLILNETISWLKKCKKKAFAFKVDFEKAFDSLSWGYLDSILEQMNFGTKWWSWIHGCPSSARISVLINGAATSEFSMERGIRQGDPLSPFLFIIVAEGLHIAMEEGKEIGIFEGIKLPSQGPSLSHLQYADDVIFLGSWSIENAKNLIRILRCFELASGLKINMLKSKIYGFGVQGCELELVAWCLNCSIGSIPFIYLGLPIGASMARAVHWNPLIAKFQAKLSKWKAFTLSFGGHLTLCKAVLGSLGSFYFSMFKAPIKVIKMLEKIRMRFFWGGDLEKRKISWVAWDKTCASKERGGLGIGSLKAQNIAMLGKWWWRFKANPNSACTVVIKSIFGVDGGFNKPSVARRKSGCWGVIASLPKMLEKDNISFVSHFQLVHNDNVPGSMKWSWDLDPSGTYSVPSLRNYIDPTILPCSDEKWQWNPLIPGKLNILAWRISHGRLPTMVNLSKIGITQSTLCKICGEAPETEYHLFIDCGIAKELCQRIVGWWRLLDPNVQAINDLLNCKNLLKGHKRLGNIHEGIMLVFLWVIWSFRNLKAHSSGAKSLSVLAYEVQSMSAFWINARNRKGVSLRWLD